MDEALHSLAELGADRRRIGQQHLEPRAAIAEAELTTLEAEARIRGGAVSRRLPGDWTRLILVCWAGGYNAVEGKPYTYRLAGMNEVYFIDREEAAFHLELHHA